jgi:hypothetical protein
VENREQQIGSRTYCHRVSLIPAIKSDRTSQPGGSALKKTRVRTVLPLSTALLAPLLLAGCAGSDQQALSASLSRYAELSTRTATANWPVEFGEVLAGDALAAAEAGFLLLADAGLSQVGQVRFHDLEVTGPGEAKACLDLSQSRLLLADGTVVPNPPNELVELGYQRLGGAVKISSFDLAGSAC